MVVVVAEARMNASCSVFDPGAFTGLALTRLLGGVPSMVESVFLYVFVDARKSGVLSPDPELEPGLLLGREEARRDPWL